MSIVEQTRSRKISIAETTWSQPRELGPVKEHMPVDLVRIWFRSFVLKNTLEPMHSAAKEVPVRGRGSGCRAPAAAERFRISCHIISIIQHDIIHYIDYYITIM